MPSTTLPVLNGGIVELNTTELTKSINELAGQVKELVKDNIKSSAQDEKQTQSLEALSKNFLLKDKFYFALGASIASIIFFYSLGYLSVFFARFITKVRVWRAINLFIIVFMLLIIAYIVLSTYYLVTNTLN